MGIKINTGRPWERTEAWLRRLAANDAFASLDRYGQRGVDALKAATPYDDGDTAAGWYYEVVRRSGYYSIRWHNRNVIDGVPIAIILQYGHGTGTGGFVQGRDYINPVIQPVFDQNDAEVRKVVTG